MEVIHSVTVDVNSEWVYTVLCDLAHGPVKLIRKFSYFPDLWAIISRNRVIICSIKAVFLLIDPSSEVPE